MKVRVLPLAIISLFLLIGGEGCNDDSSDYDIVAKGTLIFDPTYTIECSPRTHILKRNIDELQLVILSDDGVGDTTYNNVVVTIYGNKIKQLSNSCPVVFDVKEIIKK